MNQIKNAHFVELQTIKASYTPYYIDVKDDAGISIRISNVLLGEVWLCSGQSNMEMPVRGWLPDCPIDYADQIAQSSTSFPGIRCVMVKEIKGAKPLDECKGKYHKVIAVKKHTAAQCQLFYFYICEKNRFSL